MKVKELISKMTDSYVEIAVNEYKGVEHTGRRWILEPHAVDYTHIPEEICNKEVSMIIPYYDRISIEIDADSPDEDIPIERPVWKNREIIGYVDVSLKDKDFLNENGCGCFYIGFTNQEKSRMKESF